MISKTTAKRGDYVKFLKKITLTPFIYFKQKFHPPCLFHTHLLFFIWAFSSLHYLFQPPLLFRTQEQFYFLGSEEILGR